MRPELETLLMGTIELIRNDDADDLPIVFLKAQLLDAGTLIGELKDRIAQALDVAQQIDRIVNASNQADT